MLTIITPSIRLSSTLDCAAELGESPAVDHARGQVWWVDITGRRLHRTEIETGGARSWTMPEEPGFVVLDAAGWPVLGMETGLFAFEPLSGSLQKLLEQPRAGHRFNDATVDAGGILWVSTMSLSADEGAGSIFRIAADLVLVPVVEGLTIPNGMAVDCGRRRLYFSDSHRDVRTIWTAGLCEDGEVGEPAVFADMKAMAGRPDGAALDAAGRYWIAAVDGAALEVFSPDGDHLFEVPLPVNCPTKPAFHGERLDQLVVTSKRDTAHGGRLAFLSFEKDFVRGTHQARWSRTSPRGRIERFQTK
ncbi:sugar lactone lactonase YvrE [Hoeflea marina]|uniref:Sugar lactone lactonase YvrE n=1 Tax=Hoeflea marina TaxID=274592 RepID=A0A317PGW0_9HYPH|nr:SMP-30/gluconolactonase/LRE family protein [Hoeflea marina]PWV99176.1 sugar lactone lactonase YvrE [Hoeflea marina]